MLLSLKGDVFKELHISKTILQRMKLRGNKLITDICYTCISWCPWQVNIHNPLSLETALVMANSCTLCSAVCLLSCFRGVWLFGTPGTAAPQAPLSLGFSSQAYWSGLPCPPPGESSWPGIEPLFLTSPALAGRVFTSSTPGKPSSYSCNNWQCWSIFSAKLCHPTSTSLNLSFQ